MADAAVRPAGPADVAEVARLQVQTWRTAYAAVLPAVALAVDVELAEASWGPAVADPPSPAHRVLVATEGSAVVGFAAVTPDDDPAEVSTAVIATLLVEPRWGRRGHGSRLLAAVVDLARAQGVVQLRTWVLERDPTSAAFYTSAGWARDGWVRTLDMAGTTVRETRLHTTIAEAP